MTGAGPRKQASRSLVAEGGKCLVGGWLRTEPITCEEGALHEEAAELDSLDHSELAHFRCCQHPAGDGDSLCSASLPLGGAGHG